MLCKNRPQKPPSPMVSPSEGAASDMAIWASGLYPLPYLGNLVGLPPIGGAPTFGGTGTLQDHYPNQIIGSDNGDFSLDISGFSPSE